MSLSTATKSIKFMRRFFNSKWKREAPLSSTEKKDVRPITPAKAPLPYETPESVGIPSDVIESFLRELSACRNLNMHNVIIARNGKTVCRAVFGAQNIHVPKYTFSACKSIISLGIGILIDEGLLSPEDKVGDIFDKECPPISRIKLRGVTVEQLLTMQSGVMFSELDSVTSESWLESILGGTMYSDISKVFRYNSLNTYLLAAIIVKRTGMSVFAYLDERLFKPLSITDCFWEKSPDGIEKGGWGLYIRPEDMIKLGQLVMDRGVYGGKRIISPSYIDFATTGCAVAPDSYGDYNYGWQIWAGRRENVFLFNGMFDQNLFGFFDNGILIETNCGNKYNFQQSEVFKLVSKYFGGTFFDSLPENKKAQKGLENYVNSLSDFNTVAKKGDRAIFNRFKGITLKTEDKQAVSVGLLTNSLQLVENNFTEGITELSISDRSDMVELLYREGSVFNRMVVGIEKPVISVLTFGNQKYYAAVKGTFGTNEDDLPVFKVQIDFIETPFTRTLKLVLDGDRAMLTQDETPGKNYILNTIDEMADSETGIAIVSSAVDKEILDIDYLEYRVEKTFTPSIEMYVE